MFTSNGHLLFDYIIRILIEFLRHVHKYDSKNFDRLNDLWDLLLGKWANILEESTKNTDEIVTVKLIELMSQIAMTCLFELCAIATKAPGFEQWLLHIISDNEKSMEMKLKALFLWPCLIGSNTQNTNVNNVLRSFRAKYFRLETKKFRDSRSSEAVRFHMYPEHTI